MENKPRISKLIGRGYLLLTVAILILYVAMTLCLPFHSMLGILISSIAMVAVVIILATITYFFYRTTYSIKDGRLYSWSPFAKIDVVLKDIAEVEQTRVPLYFKGFGASLYCGRFYVPAIGWTRFIITNLTDGLLIKTKDKKNYLITPSNPNAFAKVLKQKKGRK